MISELALSIKEKTSRWRDSNPRPADYESAAQPAKLQRHKPVWLNAIDR